MEGEDGRAYQCAAFLTGDVHFDEVFIPEDFTGEHKDIAGAVEDFVRDEIMDLGDEIETLDYDLSRRLMKKCGELGFLGIDVVEAYGGMELDKISSAVVSEKFGYGAGSFAVTELNHTGIGTLPLSLFGTEEQRQKYLPGLISGDLIGCFGLTEPNAGSDALNSQSKASLSEDGKHYILNGTKQFITNAGFADIIFTYAKVDSKLFTAFIVETKWDGVSTDEEEQKMGMHGTSTRAFHFDNVKIPIANVLGEVGKGHVVALNALNMGRYKGGANCVGTAKRAFLEGVKYAKQRVQFGKPICEFGLIKEKISEMAIRVFVTESMVYRTAGLIQSELERRKVGFSDSGMMTAKVLEDFVVECSINKVYGTETEDLVTDEELQIFGGYGYIHGNHPEVAYRNARIARIWEGTNEMNRLVILNAILAKTAKNAFALTESFQRAARGIKTLQPVGKDKLESLDAQTKLLDIVKTVSLYILGRAYQRYGTTLREEEEVLGTIANMIIEIYAMESALLRTRKMLQRQPNRASIPVLMTKVLLHDGVQRVAISAVKVLEGIEDMETLENDLKNIRKLLIAPATNTVVLRRKVADSMIQSGRYFF